ncbi:MAG: ketopantoate reductase family protein [Thermoplasmatales archaeon]|nr:ketopantoate reductase family protein [Thermoplasmatales archaeon]
MKFIIFGAGAIGSLFGGLLSRKNDVLLVGRKEHIEEIEKNGLIVEGFTNEIFYPKTEWDGSKYDFVILTTKAYDTEKAVDEILRKFGEIPIISIQNGLRNEEIIAEKMGIENVIGALTTHGVTFIGNGRIYHAGKGETIIGELSGEITDRIKNICKTFNECGIETKISGEIKKEKWKKAIVNSAINGLTSILRCKNGEIIKNEYAIELIKKICTEAIEVAKAEGIEIEDIIEKVKEVAENTSENISSMLQDIISGKKTEVDEINGEIIIRAKKHGIKTPVNEVIYSLIKANESVRHLG